MAQPNMMLVKTRHAENARQNAPNRSTVDCVALDGDMAYLETTVNQIIANLMLLMRDDGVCADNNAADNYFHSYVIDRIFRFFEEKIKEVITRIETKADDNKARLDEHARLIKALQDAVTALQKRGIVPQTLTEHTTNTYFNGELSHRVARADLKVRGIVKLNDDVGSDKTDEAATIGALRRVNLKLAADMAALKKELEAKIAAAGSGGSGAGVIGAFLQRKEFTQAGAVSFVVPDKVTRLRVTLVAGGMGGSYEKPPGLGVYRPGRPGLMLYQQSLTVVAGQKLEGKVGKGIEHAALGGGVSDIAKNNEQTQTTLGALTAFVEWFGHADNLYVLTGEKKPAGYDRCVPNSLYPYGRAGLTGTYAGSSGYLLIEW